MLVYHWAVPERYQSLTVVIVVLAVESRCESIAALTLALDAVVEVLHIRRHVPGHRGAKEQGNTEEGLERHFAILEEGKLSEMVVQGP